MTIPALDLFTPAPSGIGPQSSTKSPPAGSWMAQNLDNAVTVGLDTTAWQALSPTRSWLAISAIDQARQDAIVSTMIQGTFLDWAATGTVSYVDTTGATITTPVSPDPSDPSSGNTTGAPTWLDLLASSKYAVTRLAAAPATLSVALVNTSGVTPATYPAGTYHVQDASNTTSTYANDAALSIPPSAVLGTAITAIGTSSPISITTSTAHGLATGAPIFIAGAPLASKANGFWQVTKTGANTVTLNGSTAGTGGSAGRVYATQAAPFTADGPGPAFTASPGAVSLAVTTNTGVSVWNFASCTGIPYESNVSVASRCRLKLQALSPNGAKGAYDYFAQTAYSLLLGTPTAPPLFGTSIRLTLGPVTRSFTKTDPLTGTVTVAVAPSNPTNTSNGTPVVPGVTSTAISGATNASPISIYAVAHGLSDGEEIVMSGVLGNSGANGPWAIHYVDADHFTLNGSTGTGTYTGGGQFEGGDLGLVDAVIQQTCVPDGDTGSAVSGVTKLIAIAGSATVPTSQRGAYIANANSMLAAYVNALDIGGMLLPGGSWGLELDAIIGILYAAGVVGGAPSYVKSLSGVTINGVAADLAFATSRGLTVGVLYPTPSLSVQGT